MHTNFHSDRVNDVEVNPPQRHLAANYNNANVSKIFP